MLVPPANFGVAEEGIYRCSKLETLNLSFLESLNLKSIIFIGGQEPSKFFIEFFNRSSIEWQVLRMADLSASNINASMDKKTHLIDQNKNNKNNNTTTNNNNNNNNNAERIIQNSNEDKTEETSINKITNHNDNSKRNDINTNNILNSNTHQSVKILNNINDNKDNKNNSKYINTPFTSYTLTDSDELMLIKSKCLRKTFNKLLDCENYNILLVDKTALIIGILRKIQKWNIASIINEYRLYSGKHSSYFAETFLELIDINIEQERESTSNLLNGLSIDTINKSKDNEEEFPTHKRQTSNIEIISEEDLCKPPKVPERLLKMVEEAEHNEQLKIMRENDLDLPQLMRRTDSDLGIFGHRYRLAFNKKESGNYEYYKGNSTNNNDAIKIKIPKESKLPSWFTFQRDIWEKDNVQEVHHFYKEQIFT